MAKGTGWSKDPKNEARYRANNRYNAKAYDDLRIHVKKGERERYKNEAERLGLSNNQLFVQSVDYCLQEKIFEKNKNTA